MAEKFTPSVVGSLIDTTTAATAINNNFSAISTVLDDVLSLSGVQPNSMQANLDMNSNHILNLPAPITSTEPLRLIDANTLNGGGSISVSSLPAGGTAGEFLTKNSSTNYDVSWQNSQTAGTLPTGGVLGQVLTKTSSANYATNWVSPSNNFNVISYGADPTGVTSSTTAINNAIAAAKVVGGVVFFPPGIFLVDGGINATNVVNGSESLTLQGSGRWSTFLVTRGTTNALLDLTGSNDVVVRDLQLSPGNQTSYGILSAASSTQPSNVLAFINVTIESEVTDCMIYIYGTGDSYMQNVVTGHYNPSANYVMCITNSNILYATSIYTTIVSGTHGVGDWAFYSCEIHDQSTSSTNSTVVPLVLSGITSPVKFYGGLIAGSVTGNTGCVNFMTSVSYAVSFIGVQFYADNGLQNSFVFYSNYGCVGLTVQGCILYYSNAAFACATPCVWKSLNVTSNQLIGPSNLFTPPTGNYSTLTGSIIDCYQCTINVGSSGTVSHCLLMNLEGSITGTSTSNGIY